MLLDPHAGTLGLATIEQMTDELIAATAALAPAVRRRLTSRRRGVEFMRLGMG